VRQRQEIQKLLWQVTGWWNHPLSAGSEVAHSETKPAWLSSLLRDSPPQPLDFEPRPEFSGLSAKNA
jgi:hypothetical protein